MEISEKTKQLIQRIENVNLRQEYVFDKEKISEILKKSYELFSLSMPKIVFCKDITDEKFAWAAWAASIDYDFDYFVETFEYCQESKGNENDEKFLKAMFLFLEAKEAGLGYFAEQDGILYCCPNPIVKLDEQLQFHSEIKPAIYWKDGLECYLLNGVNFKKDLWQEIVSKKIPTEKAIKLENAEQRAIALKYIGGERLEKDLGGIIKAKDKYGELIELTKLKDSNNVNYVYLKAFDVSENSYIYIRVSPKCKTPQEAESKSYRLEMWNLEYNPNCRT